MNENDLIYEGGKVISMEFHWIPKMWIWHGSYRSKELHAEFKIKSPRFEDLRGLFIEKIDAYVEEERLLEEERQLNELLGITFHTNHELYSVWTNMHVRCKNGEHKSYHRYGGRGIRVCERWNSFPLFVEDMGMRPTPKYQIDRTNNDGNYEPGNCRWVTPKENSLNRECVLKKKHLATKS
jgi:hypothetical protein